MLFLTQHNHKVNIAVIVLFVIAAMVSSTASPAWATVYYVDDDAGADGNAGTSWALANATIAGGVADAAGAAGNQIWVEAGTYAESVTLGTTDNLYGDFAGTEAALGDRTADLTDNQVIITVFIYISSCQTKTTAVTGSRIGEFWQR